MMTRRYDEMNIKNNSRRSWYRAFYALLLLITPALACTSSATPVDGVVPTVDETANAQVPTSTVPVPAWGPGQLEWENIGGNIAGAPVAVSWEPSRLDIFALGADGAIYHKAWNASGWYPSEADWENLGGNATDPPVVVSWGPNRLDIFIRGTEGGVHH